MQSVNQALNPLDDLQIHIDMQIADLQRGVTIVPTQVGDPRGTDETIETDSGRSLAAAQQAGRGVEVGAAVTEDLDLVDAEGQIGELREDGRRSDTAFDAEEAQRAGSQAFEIGVGIERPGPARLDFSVAEPNAGKLEANIEPIVTPILIQVGTADGLLPPAR